MTPADVLRELALVAVVTTVWTGLVLLMLERDLKRRARIERMTDSHQGAEASESRPSSSPTKEPRATAAQENTDV